MLCVADASMFEQINLGQVLIILTFIVSFGSAAKKITKSIDDWFAKKLSPALEPMAKDIKSISSKVSDIEVESYKRYLVLFMSGVERGEVPDEVERALFDEVYARYTAAGGNSYIHRKYKKLEDEGKI